MVSASMPDFFTGKLHLFINECKINRFFRLPEHWSHPDEFYPEHFSKEEKANRNP